MAYGVLAKAAGMSDFIMQLGAGGYNFFEAVGGWSTWNDIKSLEFSEAMPRIKKGWAYEKDCISTYFDDPRDNAAIRLGAEYYYKI